MADVISPKFEIGDVVLVFIYEDYPQRILWPAKIVELCYADTEDYLYGVKLYGYDRYISIRDETKIRHVPSRYFVESKQRHCSPELLNAINQMNDDMISRGIQLLQPRQLTFTEEEEEQGWMERAFNRFVEMFTLPRGFIEWLWRRD